MGYLNFDFLQIVSAFVVLFAVIDVAGLIPILISLKEKGEQIDANKAAVFSLATFLAFLFMGDVILKLFGVDISSFAVAGALVIFGMAIEMIFGIELFKMDGPKGTTTIVPVVFPLIAGAGSFTALLSLRAEYFLSNIIIALVLNIAVVYLVIRKLDLIARLIGAGGVYVLRKFFGIILLAISVKLFMSNLKTLLSSI
ncbi:MAG: MarC family protein [Bacteroidaceae bacterium]|nr:MarC family protein [Bacteroidaceae bacterium]